MDHTKMAIGHVLDLCWRDLVVPSTHHCFAKFAVTDLWTWLTVEC